MNGINGMKVTGSNDNFIFLPTVGDEGSYWGSTLEEYDMAWGLWFDSGSYFGMATGRERGRFIRPVTD